MGSSHIRVYIDPNWQALSDLPPTAYKVLIALVQRADSVGRCFPSAERIGDDIGLHPDRVFEHLKTLEECRYIGYLRRNASDPITGRRLPNVYIVSPFFISLADEMQGAACTLWQSVYPHLPSPLLRFRNTNQQQEPESLNNTKKPASINNNNNQHFSKSEELFDGIPSPFISQERAKTGQKQSDSEQSIQQGASPTALSESNGRSAAAAHYGQDYANPEPIPTPLPDEIQEGLARTMNELEIPMPLCRAFVTAYGWDICEVALKQVRFAMDKQEIRNPAGLFRKILQHNLIDIRLQKEKDFKSGKYSDFIES